MTVPGLPRPQGSLKLFRAPSGQEVAKYGDVLYQWRRTVTAAVLAEREGCEPEHGPVNLYLNFRLPRPKGHYGTGRNADALKESAPLFPASTPDLDKLVRAVGDAITDSGVVWKDDAQVVQIRAMKRYAVPGETAVGVEIIVMSAEVPQ
jgi:Holliday junction resolvase RusA-like endonuclease